LVVWVHGGGWQIGDKANRMDDKVELWNGAGWAVASIDYRLTDPDEPAATRVVAPMHDEDVASAVGWLIRNSDDLGVDPGRVALLGHSAGAGIAAALASDPRYLGAEGLEPTSLSCVAPLDTEGFDVAAVIEEGGASARLYRTVFGDDEARWRDLSPIEHLGEGAVPDLFLVTRGSADRRAKVAAFAAAATGSGAAVTVVDLPSFSHGDVNVRIGADGDDVLTPALQAFLSGCLGGGEDAQAVP
jgi:acetyl esterase/lipase